MPHYAHFGNGSPNEHLIPVNGVNILVTQSETWDKKGYITIHGAVVAYKADTLNDNIKLSALRTPTLEEHIKVVEEIERYKAEGDRAEIKLEGPIKIWYEGVTLF